MYYKIIQKNSEMYKKLAELRNKELNTDKLNTVTAKPELFYIIPVNSNTGKKITEIIKIHDKYHDATIKALNKTVGYCYDAQEYRTSHRYSLEHKEYYGFVVHPLWVSNVPSDCIKATIEEYKKLFNETFI